MFEQINIAGEDERIKAGHRLPSVVPKIRILLYADDPFGIRPGRDISDLGTMIDHIYAHQPAFACFDLKWLSRNCKDADHKLNPEMLKSYDEIWFFGIHRLNSEPHAPESELNEQEVRALADWMAIDEKKELTGGGVLVTGDHAEPRPAGTPGKNACCPDTSTKPFLGLGRALGRCVPRAGLLRKWEGPPTNDPADSFDTQTPAAGLDPGASQLQTDEFAMRLVLSKFDALGKPSSAGVPHILFSYPGGRFIRVFPDHLHEGAVIIPGTFDEKVWPKKTSVWPKPQVVARGVDYRNGKLINILAAYDGDRAGVGRVAADSTWHHYLNENLPMFKPPGQTGSDADQIGQFYANLALWLAPFKIRHQMTHVMFDWLASRLSVQEESRSRADADIPSAQEVAGLGRAAYSALTKVASPCEIHELLMAALPPEYRDNFESLYLPETGASLSLFPSREQTLGFIIDSYQHARSNLAGRRLEEQGRFEMEDSIWEGFRRAFQSHVDRLQQFASEAASTHDLKFD